MMEKSKKLLVFEEARRLAKEAWESAADVREFYAQREELKFYLYEVEEAKRKAFQVLSTIRSLADKEI